jgi:EmrB/QacA subfamily drug resistance transporter
VSPRKTNPWIVLVLVCLAQFMVVLDATITNVALPSIKVDLGMSDADLQWIVNAYTLIFGGFLLLGGRAGDLIGRKRVFLIGVVLFTCASMLCGFSNSQELLIIGRGIQGLGAALVSPAALSIVTTTFAEGSERTKAMGVWAAIAVGGGAVGLVLGGALTEYLSWPWIFFVNVPVGIVAFILSLRLVPESRDESAQGKGFDFGGAISITSGLILLVYAIVRSAEKGWGSGEVLGLFAAAAVLIAIFVVIEMRHKAPLVNLSIFSVRTIRGANIAMLLVASGLFAMFFFNTLYTQTVLGYSPLQAGLAFIPFTAGIIVGSVLSQVLIPRLGAREVPVIGLVMATLGMLAFLRLDVGGSYWTDLLPGILLCSIGMGLVFVPVTLIATSGVPSDEAGLASGLFNTSQQIGGALGLAILSTLAASKTDDVIKALGGSPEPGDTAHALVEGFHVAYIGSAILLAAAAIVLLVLLRRSDVAAVSGEVPESAGIEGSAQPSL